MTASKLLVTSLVLGGCNFDYEPDVGLLPAIDAAPDPDSDIGPTGNPRCSDGDPTVTVSFSEAVLPLLSRSPGACTGCHGASATAGLTVLTYEGLRRGGQISGSEVIVPGDPCGSGLLQKLGPAPPFGARMPYNGPPFYSAQDLDLIRDWIAEGAANN
jgi:hypothetical protein